MRKTHYWQDWSHQELLKLKIRDLGLVLEGTSMQSCIDQILDELVEKGLNFKPHFWLSDEWFSPEGVPGVAIPFYLLSPRLKALEKHFMGEVEGATKTQCLKLLRHEVGHAIETAYGLQGSRARKRTFGDSKKKPYPISYSPIQSNGRYVHHLGYGYAQAHPDEDFAETFAVWLNPKSNWKLRYRGRPVFKKLLEMDRLMNSIKGQSPKNQKIEIVDEIGSNKNSLKSFYEKKVKKFRIKSHVETDIKLLEVFEPMVLKKKGRKASLILRSMQNDLAKILSEVTGHSPSKERAHVAGWIKRADSLNLAMKYNDSRTKRQVLDLLIWDRLEDLHQERDKIIL